MEGLRKLRAALTRLLNWPFVIAVPPARGRDVSVGANVINSQISTGDIINISLAPDTPRAHAPLHQLPADVADFAGRAVQMEKLLGLLNTPGGRVAISAIGGMGGLGKTTLAVHVAHCLTERYPDGQIVVDMAATSAAPLSPAQALARVIRAFDPLKQLSEAVTELRPIYLSVLRGKRVLLILDDALNGDQVAPLLPPEDCAVIVTSRRQIAVSGLTRVDLDLLAPDEATDLLRTILGDTQARPAELSRIAELCGLLPLALRVVGMVGGEAHRCACGRAKTAWPPEAGASLDVTASLALSVGELRRSHPDIADRWHELAVFPTSFDTAAAASVWDQSVEAADEALGLLLSHSMVFYDPDQQRWRLHDLMRDLAGGHATAQALGASADLAARLTAARRRHAVHYWGVLATANDLYLKGGARVLSGLELLDRERRNIETGQALAAGSAAGDPVAARLCVFYPVTGASVLRLRHHPRQRIAWLEAAIDAARTIGDRPREGSALVELGLAYAALGEPRRAIECHEQALVIAREIGNRDGESAALDSLGLAYHYLGEFRRAIGYHKQALIISRSIGDRRAEGKNLGNLGIAYRNIGEHRRAIEYYKQQLTITREVGDRRGEGVALGNLGIAYAALGERRRAIECHEQQLTIGREIGDLGSEGRALNGLGISYAELGEPRRAIASFRGALDIFEAIESPQAAMVRANIAKLLERGAG
jgi:tetratricopeptide (TPR) repeat protein